MTLPTITTRVAFASDPMADSPSWTTLSGVDVMRFTTRRGRNHELDRVQAGQAAIILNNNNNKYWPDLTTGPYYTNIKPGKRVNIRATHYPLAWVSPTGYVNIGAAYYYPTRAYDGDTNTFAYTTMFRGAMTNFLELTHPGVTATKLRYYGSVTTGTPTIDIDIYYGGAWHDLYYGVMAQNTWTEVDFGGAQDITSVRVRGYYSGGNRVGQFRINELELWNNGPYTYDLYTGFVDKWTPSFRSLSGRGAIISVSCLDAQNNLARYLLNNAGEVLELSGTRVGNVLDEIGFPAADRALDTGQSYMIATGAQANVNAMDHLFTVQDSEYGVLFFAGNGYATFHDRHHRLLTTECNTSQATFGNDSTERRFVDIVLDMDAKDVLNDIRVTRSGGSEQTASDSTSQDTYGKRSLSRTGLLMPTDAEASDQANYILSRFKDGTLRVKALVIRPQGDPTNLWPKVLSYDIGYRITLNLDRAGISKDYHIEGISHSVDSQTGTWETRWELSDADSQNYWILDTSELDTNTRLAY